MKRELRKRILKRDKRICQICGKIGAGQVHHLIPKSKGGPDSEDNLVTLCGKCHLLISPVPESLLKRILDMNSEEILKAREEVERKLKKL